MNMIRLIKANRFISAAVLGSIFAVSIYAQKARNSPKVVFQSDTGKIMGRCNNCQNAVYDGMKRNWDTATVHLDKSQETEPYGHFELIQLNGGKIALKSDNGKYLARCRNCIVSTTCGAARTCPAASAAGSAAYPDFLTIHITDYSLPYAQFELIKLSNGKYALKSDNGKYVARCRNCSPGAAYADTVTIHADDPENQTYAQWDMSFLP